MYFNKIGLLAQNIDFQRKTEFGPLWPILPPRIFGTIHGQIISGFTSCTAEYKNNLYIHNQINWVGSYPLT